MAWDEPGLLLTTISLQIKVKCDAINIVCVCVCGEREREGGGGGGGGIQWNEYRNKTKIYLFYFIRPSANIVPWLPTHSTEP